MSGAVQDLRFGVRMLAKNRGFTAVAVATLALGIGANTAIFSVARASLVTPIPIAEAERVVVVWTENPGRQWHHMPASIPDFRDWKNSGGFAALGLLLAAIGIYGVVAYSAGRRTHEIGIRMALGAGKTEVLRLLLGQGMMLTLLGIAAGLAGSLALAKLLAAALPGAVSVSPLPFAGASLVLAAAAFLASYIPALRATKTDPVYALRIE